MNLSEKHYYEKNKTAQIVYWIVDGVMFILSAAALLKSFSLLLLIRVLWCGVTLFTTAFLFRKMKYKHKYRLVVTLSLAVLYPLVLLSATNIFVTNLMYAILLIVMVYGESSAVIAGSTEALLFLVIYDIFAVKDGRMLIEGAVYHIIFALVCCVLASIICKQQLRQSKESNDEADRLMASTKETAENIVDLASKLNEKFIASQDASERLNESMESTHNSVLEIVEGTRNTAAAIEKQTSQTADISDSIQKVGEQANNIGDISARVESVVEEGVDLINQLKQQAVELANINLETQETTKALNESIKDVHDITDTILGISNQTNLLALNASIEAARAGEAGKGFAVVADEIRTLSENTRQATEKIAEIISRLTKDADDAGDAMAKSAEFANKQHELIDETGAKLDDIKTHTDELHAGVLEVNDSVNVVVEANRAIMDSISNLSATSEEVAASTDTVLQISTQTVEALGGMNENLEEINNISLKMDKIASNE